MEADILFYFVLIDSQIEVVKIVINPSKKINAFVISVPKGKVGPGSTQGHPTNGKVQKYKLGPSARARPEGLGPAPGSARGRPTSAHITIIKIIIER